MGSKYRRNYETKSKILSLPEVIRVTATATQASDTRIMQRVVDEAEYVLTVLRRMRDEVLENPEQYDSDAQERMDEAIARIQHVLEYAQAQLKNWTEKQNFTAA